MPSDQELAGFIRSSFRSVWTLELLLYLKQRQDRAVSRADLLDGLRASDAIVSNGTASLLAAGLIVVESDGAARYGPAGADLEALADGAETLYAQRPDAVRRLIVGRADDGVAAFADAFRLRRD